VDDGKIRYLGVSNVGMSDLNYLMEHARIQPKVVQNMFKVYKPGQQTLETGVQESGEGAAEDGEEGDDDDEEEEGGAEYRLKTDGYETDGINVEGDITKSETPEGKKKAKAAQQLAQVQSFKDYCLSRGLLFVGYGVINAWPYLLPPLYDPHVVKVAFKYGKPSSQILLRWALQHGVHTISRSGNMKHIEENAPENILNFELTEFDMHVLDSIALVAESPIDGNTPAWSPDLYELFRAQVGGADVGSSVPRKLMRKHYDALTNTTYASNKGTMSAGGVPRPARDLVNCHGKGVQDFDIGETCWKALWVFHGCLESTVPRFGEWHQGQSMMALFEDSRQWATLEDAEHRIACYGQATKPVAGAGAAAGAKGGAVGGGGMPAQVPLPTMPSR